MQRVLHDFFKFAVIENSPFGRGCVATSEIKEGEIICKMMGPTITGKDFLDKYEVDECNVLQVDVDSYIDLIEPFVCFNHSCDPNAGLRNNGILFALKNIKIGTEIFYDYSMSVDDVLWSMQCACGSANCRKIIGDFQSIPHEQKMEYFKKNALTRYLKQTYF